MGTSDTRSEYLIQWRQGLWTQIRQKEDAIWRFIAFFSSAILVVAGFLTGSVISTSSQHTPLAALLMVGLTILIVTIWGLLITLDANFWLGRNLLFIGNIEREILGPTDLGVLLPAYYAEPTFRYSQSYVIHLYVFFSTVLLNIIGIAGLTLVSGGVANPNEQVVLFLVAGAFCAGLAYVFYRDQSWYKEYWQVRSDAPGKNPSPRKYPARFDAASFFFGSGVFYWLWSLSFAGVGFLTFQALITQTQFSFQPWLKFAVFGIIWLLGTLGIICFLIIRFRVVPQCRTTLDSLADLAGRDKSQCVANLDRYRRIATSVLYLLLGIALIPWILILISAIDKIVANL